LIGYFDTVNDKMSGSSPYWLVGDAPSTPVSLSPPITPDSSLVNERNLTLEAPTVRRPQSYVAIQSNANISWVPPPPQNGNVSPAILIGGKERAQFPSVIGAQHVSVVQHVPPTHQRHYNTSPSGSESFMHERNSANGLVSSSTSISELDRNLDRLPIEPVNYRDDIELDDKKLVTISTKELNRQLKKKGIGNARKKEIKCERRTLKNRGYASNCRVSREDEEKRLEKDIKNLEEDIKKYPPVENLGEEYRQLRDEVKILQQRLNITDDSDDSIEEFPTKNEIKEEDIKSEEDDFSSTDDDNEGDDD